MLLCKIDYGFIYYHKTRRRTKIEFSKELRTELKKTVDEMYQYLNRNYTPKVKPSKKCQSCSIKEICLPKLLKIENASTYLKRRLNS